MKLKSIKHTRALLLFAAATSIASSLQAHGAQLDANNSKSISYFEQGIHELDMFRPDTAIRDFSRAYFSAKTASKATKSKIFLLIGRSFQFDDNEKAASQAFSIAHELNPDDQVTTAYLAYSLARSGHKKEAAPYFELLKAQKNKARTTIEILALEAAKTSDPESGKKYLDSALKEPGGDRDPYVHYIYAKFLSKLGHTEQSRQEFSKAAETMPNAYIKTLLGATLARIDGDPKKQMACLKEAGKLLPKDPGWHFELADCYAAQGNKRDALEQYNLAMQGRFSGRAYARTVNFLREEHRYKDAINVARHLIAMKPWSSDAHQTLASLYFSEKDYPNAEREAKKAIELDKYNENSYVELAHQYSEQGQTALARDAYKAGLVYSPKSMGLLRRLGDTEAKLNNEPAARACYQKIIDNLPNPKDVNVLFQHEYALAQAKLGSRYYAENQLDKASAAAQSFNKFKFVPKLPPLLTLLHLRPGHIEAGKTALETEYNNHILLADMLREGGHLDDCIAEYRKAETLNPDEVDLHSYLLNALDEKGDILNAARENMILSSKLVNRVPVEVRKLAGANQPQMKPLKSAD